MRVEITRPSKEERQAAVARQLTEEARAIFAQQAEAISALAERIDDTYAHAVELLRRTPGHVIVSGMGKSGLIGRKMAATFASTGTPSFFVHPGEAYHGDLGMITERDTVILFSYSGETEEVVRLLPHLERQGVPVIAMTGEASSTLAKFAHAHLDASVNREACPNNLAPTNSTLAAMAMGDALAVSLIRARDFQAQDFARFHPGGSLGRRLLTRVKDVMHSRDLPFVDMENTVRDSLFTITRGRLGLALCMQDGQLKGVVTDGDLRRAMQRFEDVLERPISDIMGTSPIVVDENAQLSEAESIMRRMKIKAIIVTGSGGAVTGVLEIFNP